MLQLTPSQNPADMFEDVPLDVRHHTFKTKPRFPKGWRLTEKRREELETLRKQSFLLDETKTKEGTLVNGAQRIQHALAPPPEDVQDRVAELMTVSAHPRQSGRGARPQRR